MKEKQWTRNGMRQIIHSGHATFDRQTTLITVGNHWGRTQWSNYIRPYNEVECNGRINEPGHLREFDLNQFRHVGGVPNMVRSYLESVLVPVILNCFFHRAGDRKIVHGWIVVSSELIELPKRHYLHRVLRTFVTGPTRKSWQVLKCCEEYCTD